MYVRRDEWVTGALSALMGLAEPLSAYIITFSFVNGRRCRRKHSIAKRYGRCCSLRCRRSDGAFRANAIGARMR